MPTFLRHRLTLSDHVQPKVADFNLPPVVDQTVFGGQKAMGADERLVNGNQTLRVIKSVRRGVIGLKMRRISDHFVQKEMTL